MACLAHNFPALLCIPLARQILCVWFGVLPQRYDTDAADDSGFLTEELLQGLRQFSMVLYLSREAIASVRPVVDALAIVIAVVGPNVAITH